MTPMNSSDEKANLTVCFDVAVADADADAAVVVDVDVDVESSLAGQWPERPLLAKVHDSIRLD